MNNQMLIYETDKQTIEVRLDGQQETLWLSQKQMAELFDKDVRTINEHIKNVYKGQELVQDSTIRKFRIVQQEGKRSAKRDVDHYNLDTIISVGYRVNSQNRTTFYRDFSF